MGINKFSEKQQKSMHDSIKKYSHKIPGFIMNMKYYRAYGFLFLFLGLLLTAIIALTITMMQKIYVISTLLAPLCILGGLAWVMFPGSKKTVLETINDDEKKDMFLDKSISIFNKIIWGLALIAGLIMGIFLTFI